LRGKVIELVGIGWGRKLQIIKDFVGDEKTCPRQKRLARWARVQKCARRARRCDLPA